MIELDKLLNRKLIFFSDSQTKRDNLQELIGMIEKEGMIGDIEGLKKSILEREDLMSTGIGLGIAIPHVRLPDVDHITMAILINKEGIRDYDSLDGKPVKIVIMIIAGDEQHRDYLMLLSRIVKMLKKEFVRKAMVESLNEEQVVELISLNFDRD